MKFVTKNNNTDGNNIIGNDVVVHPSSPERNKSGGMGKGSNHRHEEDNRPTPPETPPSLHSPRRFIKMKSLRHLTPRTMANLTPKTVASFQSLTARMGAPAVFKPSINSEEIENICRHLQEQSSDECTNIAIGISSGSTQGQQEGSHQRSKMKQKISKSDISLLCDCLADHSSSSSAYIKAISIGANAPADSHHDLLDAIAENCSGLERLELNLGPTVIPLEVLMKLTRCKKLTQLSIIDTWVTTGETYHPPHGGIIGDEQDYIESSHFNFVELVPYCPNLTTLELVDCGLQNAHAIDIFKCIMKHKDTIALEELSVSENTRMSAPAFALLLRLPIRKVSINRCNLTHESLHVLAEALLQSTTSIKELDISGNPIGANDDNTDNGLLFAFLKVCFIRLEALNLSFCGIHHATQMAFITALLKSKKDGPANIKYLSLEGNAPQLTMEKVNDIWKHNDSLRGLVLSKPLSTSEPLILMRKQIMHS